MTAATLELSNFKLSALSDPHARHEKHAPRGMGYDPVTAAAKVAHLAFEALCAAYGHALLPRVIAYP